jgi:hypothetical protein
VDAAVETDVFEAFARAVAFEAELVELVELEVELELEAAVYAEDEDDASLVTCEFVWVTTAEFDCVWPLKEPMV